MSKPDSYRQCTLRRTAAKNTIIEMVEWVPQRIASIDNVVECNGFAWFIVHVGQESSDPRSAHVKTK